MINAVTAALAGKADLAFPRAAADLASLPGDGPVVLLVISADVADLERAMLLAAVGPLAVAMAPARRIAAIDIGPDASESNVIAAALFLVGAESSTGQLIRVGTR